MRLVTTSSAEISNSKANYLHKRADLVEQDSPVSCLVWTHCSICILWIWCQLLALSLSLLLCVETCHSRVSTCYQLCCWLTQVQEKHALPLHTSSVLHCYGGSVCVCAALPWQHLSSLPVSVSFWPQKVWIHTNALGLCSSLDSTYSTCVYVATYVCTALGVYP
jgi:hypothetical protein